MKSDLFVIFAFFAASAVTILPSAHAQIGDLQTEQRQFLHEGSSFLPSCIPYESSVAGYYENYIDEICVENVDVRWSIGRLVGEPVTITESRWSLQAVRLASGDYIRLDRFAAGGAPQSVIDAAREIRADYRLLVRVFLLDNGAWDEPTYGVILRPGGPRLSGDNWGHNTESPNWETLVAWYNNSPRSPSDPCTDRTGYADPDTVERAVEGGWFRSAQAWPCEIRFSHLNALVNALEEECWGLSDEQLERLPSCQSEEEEELARRIGDIENRIGGRRSRGQRDIQAVSGDDLIERLGRAEAAGDAEAERRRFEEERRREQARIAEERRREAARRRQQRIDNCNDNYYTAWSSANNSCENLTRDSTPDAIFGERYASGGVGVHVFDFPERPAQGQELRISWDTFSIPDRIVIIYRTDSGEVTAFDSGMTSGSGSRRLQPFYGNNVRVIMTGSENGTSWEFRIR